LTAVKQQKLEQRVAEAQIVQSSVAVRRAAQLAQAVARAAEAERRQAEAEAKSAAAEAAAMGQSGCPFKSSTLKRVHARTWCTLAHRHQPDFQVRCRSGHCRHTGSFVAGSSSNRKTAAAAASSQQLKERAQERAHDAYMMLWCHCLCVLLLRQKRHRGQHHSNQQLEAVRPTAEKSA